MEDNKRFVNPYNFISLPNKKASAYTDKDKHYGVIRYSITTKTPLFIPNSSNDNAFVCKESGHKSYDFFSYTDLSNENNVSGKYQEPVVPGSEMRGLVRNVYETLTDSCMGILNDDYPVKRIGVAFEPGLLHIEEDGSLSLVKATSIQVNADQCDKKKVKDGQKIYFGTPQSVGRGQKRINGFSVKQGEGKNSGYVIRWAFFGNSNAPNAKRYYHVFKPKDPVVKNDLSKNEIKDKMNSILTSYLEQPTLKSREDDAKAYEAYKESFNLFFENNEEKFFPVNFYSDNKKGLLSIAPATFSKEVSSKSLVDYAGVFAPCEEELCPACDLFGKIGDNAKGSRIRFSDMYVNKTNSNEFYYKGNCVTIANLSSPKISNVDFYLVKPKNADFWTYDYYVSNKKVYAYTGTLRGRKYYWHYYPEDVNFNKARRTNLNKTIRPVKEGITFNGELYFDGISRKQLNQLIYILNTGKDGLGYKLGMGKPLGLGSVTCKVNAVEERKIMFKQSKVSYDVSSYDYSHITYESAGLSPSVKKEFEKIAGLNSVPKKYKICYPKTTSDNDHGFEWFQNNHGGRKMPDSREEMQIKRALPKILDNDISLPQTANGSKYNGYSYNNNKNFQKKNGENVWKF